MGQPRESAPKLRVRGHEQVSPSLYPAEPKPLPSPADPSAICLIFRKDWGYLFNSDPEVVAVVATVRSSTTYCPEGIWNCAVCSLSSSVENRVENDAPDVVSVTVTLAPLSCADGARDAEAA